MSWQQFWFLHTYNICIDVQLIYCKGITFLWMGKKVVKISLYGCDYLNLVYHQSAILWVSRFRHSPISVARLQRKYRLHWKLKGRAASRFGLNLPPPESIHPENLSPFNVCTQKCRRQRKWATDENVEKDKQTAYKRVLTLITHLYAILVSIHRDTIILYRWI